MLQLAPMATQSCQSGRQQTGNRQAESAVHSGPGKYLYMHVCLPARVCTKMYINILDSKLGQPVADPKIKQAKRRDSTRRDATRAHRTHQILFYFRIITFVYLQSVASASAAAATAAASVWTNSVADARCQMLVLVLLLMLLLLNLVNLCPLSAASPLYTSASTCSQLSLWGI